MCIYVTLATLLKQPRDTLDGKCKLQQPNLIMQFQHSLAKLTTNQPTQSQVDRTEPDC